MVTDTTMTMWPDSSETILTQVFIVLDTEEMSFPPSTIFPIPVSWCAFKIEIRIVLLTTFNASGVNVLQHKTRKTIGWITLARTVLGICNPCSDWSKWYKGMMFKCVQPLVGEGGSLRDGTKNVFSRETDFLGHTLELVTHVFFF